MSWFGRNISTRVVDYGWAYRLRLSRLRSGRRPESYRRGNRSPVLLLPGVYETWHFLEPVARHLNGRGHPVHVIPTFGRNLLPIPAMAELARDYLQAHGLTDVTIVGHSKGGLIGKSLMLSDDAHRVRGMIAINSPFGGSDYARFMPVTRLREFMPTHATIVSLAENAAVNARITSVYAEWDPVIPNGSELDGATNIRIPAGGHFRIIDRQDVLDAVVRVVEASY